MDLHFITPKTLSGYSKAMFIALLFFVFFNTDRAQNKADSLIKLADASVNDSLKVKWMNDAVWELMFGEKENSLKLAKKALKIAERTTNPYSLSDCYNTLGVYYYLNADFKTSIQYHQSAMEVRTKLNDIKGLISTYNNLGSALKELGDKNEVDYYFMALKIAESKRDTIAQCSILNNIADAFNRQEQYAKAEKYHLIALGLREILGDAKGLIATYINLGTVKQHTKAYKESNQYYQKAKELLDTYPDDYLKAKYFANLGSLRKDENKLNEAIHFISESIKINEKIRSANSNLVNFVNLGALYHQQRDLKRSNEAYQKAHELSLQLGNKQWQRQSLEGLSNTYAELNNYERAFDARLKYDALNDSLRGKEVNKLFAESEAKYSSEKKDAEIKLLDEKNKNSELQIRQRTLIILGLVILILLVFIIGYFVRSKNVIRQKLETERIISETEENERIRIAKDIHDELGSGLSKIKFLAELANSNNQGKASAINSISETSKHLVENMRDLIWAMNPDNTTMDNLVARIREYASDYLEEFSIELSIDFPEEIKQLDITKEASRNILMIVKESLQNIIKHAKADKISLKLQLNTEFKFQIEDNGEGFDARKESNGNGLKNMMNRMKIINGEIKIASLPGKGSRIEMQVPLKSIEKLKILL